MQNCGIVNASFNLWAFLSYFMFGLWFCVIGDLYEKNFGLQDGFNCSNFDDCKKYINDIHEKMEDCSMKDSRFNETEKHNFYNEIYLISLGKILNKNVSF